MDYLIGIVNELLTESANVNNVHSSIKQRKEAEIYYYDAEDPDGSGKRIIQPVAYGLSKAGNMVVRAFQPYGDTKTKVPHWKLFRLDKIRSWRTLWKRTFSEPPGQFAADGKFNENGDKTMSQVYLVANFEPSRKFNRGETGNGLRDYNAKRQAAAIERDPLYKFKQNIKNSQTTKDVSNRVINNPSSAASEYVKGNDRYIKDLEKVNNGTNSTPQTYGTIEKGDTTYQDEFNDKEKVNVNNNGPIEKENN